MRIVVLGLPHTQTLDPAKNTAYPDCAFTMKTYNLCRMMMAEGHEVVHIGNGGSEPPCSRNIDVTTEAEWREVFGKRADSRLLNTDVPPAYAEKYVSGVKAAIAGLGWAPKTAVICLPWGGVQLSAVEGVEQFVVASGIGNFHPFARFRVYESYATLHAVLGQEKQLCEPQWYHVVIPNGLDPDLFGPVSVEKERYALFMGRIMENKGLRAAVQACRIAKMKLKVAGPGFIGPFVEGGDDVEYLGVVGAEQRRQLMRKATALFSPSYYVEPFGNVAVEAQMSGCPVISTDWGAFSEHVIHGMTGYRCRTMDHFAYALRSAGEIDPHVCRAWAEANYSLDRIAKKYTAFFGQILDLAGQGWYAEHPERAELDWLKPDLWMFKG